MRNTSNSLQERFVVFSKYASLIVVVIGCLVIIGWIFNIQEFKSILLGVQTTKLNTAFVFILSGIVLQIIHLENDKQNYIYIKQVLSIFILIVGLLTLSQYLFNLNLGIDELIVKDLQTAPDSFPGRMSFASSLCTIFIGFALIFINNKSKKIQEFGQYPAILVITISFLAILGYIYNVQALYKLDTYSKMGLNTAIMLTLCALSILWVRPNENWTKIIVSESVGGIILRRLLFPILVVPLILGWLILLGERAGLYENHFGLAIISVLITGFLIVTLLVNGEQLNLIDQKRKRVEERYQNVLDNLMEGAQIIGFDWRYLYVNDTVAKQGHQIKENLLGRTMMEMYPGIENTAVFTTIKLCMEERTSHMMENEFIYANGDKGWFELSIQPVEEGVFVLSNDITERKKNEVAFLKLNAELEMRIFERTAHLNSTNEQLQNELLKREQAEKIILQQNKMLSSLHEITLDLLKQNNLEQLLKRIVELSVDFLDAEYGETMLLENDVLTVKAVTANQQNLLGEKVGRTEALLSWQALDTRKPVVLRDYSAWEHRRESYNSFSLYAVADFPILNNEKSIGVLAFGRSKPNYEFTEEQIQFGSLFASLTALIIINSQLRDTLKQQSIHDLLTGLFNRRYMEETLKQEISRAVRNNHSLGIIMLDIDYFKNFNDSFGHLAGDSLLRQLGGFLQKNIRTEDVACRYGGEEFLLIMPNVSLETVKTRAELLREGISKLHWQEKKATASFGIGMYPQHGETMDSLIRSADAALYCAKENGRNRVEVAAEISN